MASFNPQDHGFDEPPPRPTTPPVRRGFLLVLFVLSLAALVVYGVPYVAERTGYAWEAGRARADSEALACFEIRRSRDACFRGQLSNEAMSELRSATSPSGLN